MNSYSLQLCPLGWYMSINTYVQCTNCKLSQEPSIGVCSKYSRRIFKVGSTSELSRITVMWQYYKNCMRIIRNIELSYADIVGLGSLWVTCSRDPRFASSNPAEVDECFQGFKILTPCPPGETLRRESWVKYFQTVTSLKLFTSSVRINNNNNNNHNNNNHNNYNNHNNHNNNNNNNNNNTVPRAMVGRCGFLGSYGV